MLHSEWFRNLQFFIAFEAAATTQHDLFMHHEPTQLIEQDLLIAMKFYKSGISIEVLKSSDAERALISEEFLETWQALYTSCSWATVFQSVDFCALWYRIYKDHFSPLLVTGTDENGDLIGLLALAVDDTRGEIVAAGAHQAEYQVWIATSDAADAFIEAALDALQKNFPNRLLRFLFLPPRSPIGWLENKQGWGGRCALRTMPRPLMEIGDGGKFKESLRKKSNRSRLNRLEGTGKVQLKQIIDAQELEAIFDEIITFGDFRLGAVQRVPVSYERDSLKKAFYTQMLQVPHLLHATVLKIDQQIISAHVGQYNRDEVMLGVFTHSPLFAKHSPSKLHLLMLGMKLAGEGIPVFDLTPGGEYKDRFATRYDDAYILTVFFNRAQYLRYKAVRNIAEAGKKLIAAANITPEQAKQLAERGRHKLKHIKVGTLPAKASRILKKASWHTSEMRIYSMDVAAARNRPRPQLMNRDNLQDLLAFEITEAWQPTMHQFLSGALGNLEAGMHVYTRVEDGRLLHYGWLNEHHRKLFIAEVGQTLYFPPNTVTLGNSYTHQQARGRGLFRDAVSQMLHDAADIPGTEEIYIWVMTDNQASRHVMEKLGFVYRYSFFQQRKLGKTLRWSNAPRSAITPPDDETA